jgi:hypothetical protein
MGSIPSISEPSFECIIDEEITKELYLEARKEFIMYIQKQLDLLQQSNKFPSNGKKIDWIILSKSTKYNFHNILSYIKPDKSQKTPFIDFCALKINQNGGHLKYFDQNVVNIIHLIENNYKLINKKLKKYGNYEIGMTQTKKQTILYIKNYT